MKAVSGFRSRFVAIFALLLMALSVVSGMAPQSMGVGGMGLVAPVFAAPAGSGGGGLLSVRRADHGAVYAQ